MFDFFRIFLEVRPFLLRANIFTLTVNKIYSVKDKVFPNTLTLSTQVLEAWGAPRSPQGACILIMRAEAYLAEKLV